MTPCHFPGFCVNYFLSQSAFSANDAFFINKNSVMPNKMDIGAAQEMASSLAGTLDLLANLHATLAVHDREARPLAATFAMLHENAARLEQLLNAD